MPLERPTWWQQPPTSWQALALLPVSLAYAAAVEARWTWVRAERVPVPVICIGNLTVGGAGKTPVALAVAALLSAHGLNPWLLTRGYGGQAQGPLQVEPLIHVASAVGDEALLLARTAPTVVSPDRRKGAHFAVARGADVIVMDDGFQNPTLAKDLSIVVIDAAEGIGNGWVLPSGPLRAPVRFQLDRTDALLVLGRGSAADALAEAMLARGRPVLTGDLVPQGDTLWLKGRRVVAFAGIGRPQKFFSTLEGLGATVVERFAFPDHHTYTREDANRLLAAAQKAGAVLVTTEKDQGRIARSLVLADLVTSVSAVSVAFAASEPQAFAELVLSAVAGRRRPQEPLALAPRISR